MKKASLLIPFFLILLLPKPAAAVNFVETEAVSLLKTASGTHTTNAVTDVSTYAVSGLSADDYLWVIARAACTTAGTTTTGVTFRSTTDNVNIGGLNGRTAIANNQGVMGEVVFSQYPGTSTSIVHLSNTTAALITNYGIDAATANNKYGSTTVTTAWTGSWTLAMTLGATNGGSCAWSWKVYKISAATTSAGASLPADASGWLKNNGSGTLSWSTPTSSDTGSVPTSRTINGYDLSANRSLTSSDLACVPTSRTINGYDLSANRSLTASDLSAVPTSRTVNGHALSSDVTIVPTDILPANASGYLNNNGSGTLAWSTPSGGSSLPPDAAGFLENDGAGSLSWNPSAGSSLPTPDAEGWLRNDGSGGLSWDAFNGDSMFEAVSLLLFFGSFLIFGFAAFYKT